MQIINSLMEESFAYTEAKKNMNVRRNEIGELMEIVTYCQDEAVKEPVVYEDVLWETYVQEGVTFTEWLYGSGGEGTEDDRRRLLEAMSKNEIISRNENQEVDGTIDMKEVGSKRRIRISLGEFPTCVSMERGYIEERRNILASIQNVKEYEAFMQSCFIKSCFAKGMLSEMKQIQDFPRNTREITRALGILNDNAVELYQKYSNHLEEAMRILTALLQRECAPDPKHADELVFSFTYSERLEGKTVARTKDIECSPHLKLLHSGSNLRIYFYWCDENVGEGKKVLVGRIGRHPYKK